MTVQAADDVYLAHRGALFGLAYRMLGSIADAEDVVAEAYLRWRGTDTDRVVDARKFLFTVTTRLALDLLRSAQRARVDYVGSWLPEPLVTAYDDPAGVVETRDTLSFGFLLLLEHLTPPQRAVFVLREAFALPHAEIAAILDRGADDVRQLYRRAQLRLAGAVPQQPPDPAVVQKVVADFLAATGSGDVAALARTLTDDAVLVGDGGGKAASVRTPAVGGLRIARFLRRLGQLAPPDCRIDLVRANGLPAMLVHTPAEVLGVYALEVDPRRRAVSRIWAVRNPDKLTRACHIGGG